MEIRKLREYPELLPKAARWFASKWGIEEAEYRRSMAECCTGRGAVPQWYVVLDGAGQMAAGAGVIENDFHDRPDLRPNLCALYVEEPFRNRGLAGEILAAVRGDMAAMGVERLYLVTDHVGFYERYGWSFLAMVHDSGGQEERLYAAPSGQ